MKDDNKVIKSFIVNQKLVKRLNESFLRVNEVTSVETRSFRLTAVLYFSRATIFHFSGAYCQKYLVDHKKL